MPKYNEQDLGAAIREVLKRSVVDPDFRQLAVKNGDAAITKVNSALAGAIDVQFIDNFGKSHKTIVLPDPVSGADQLSEEELEQVAGGCGASSCATTGVAME